MSSRDSTSTSSSPARPDPERRRLSGQHASAQRLLPPRLVLLAIAGLFLFGFPFLAVSSNLGRLAGIPFLYVYIFVAWGAFIAIIAWLVDRGRTRR